MSTVVGPDVAGAALTRRHVILALALLAAAALYALATTAGARSTSGGGDLCEGLPDAPGRLLVQPANGDDLSGPCRRGATVTIPPSSTCTFGLRSGFLARRLRLRLSTADPVTAVLSQPSPAVTDTEPLDPAHPEVELTYRQERRTLTLTCASKQPCTLRVR